MVIASEYYIRYHFNWLWWNRFLPQNIDIYTSKYSFPYTIVAGREIPEYWHPIHIYFTCSLNEVTITEEGYIMWEFVLFHSGCEFLNLKPNESISVNTNGVKIISSNDSLSRCHKAITWTNLDLLLMMSNGIYHNAITWTNLDLLLLMSNGIYHKAITWTNLDLLLLMSNGIYHKAITWTNLDLLLLMSNGIYHKAITWTNLDLLLLMSNGIYHKAITWTNLDLLLLMSNGINHKAITWTNLDLLLLMSNGIYHKAITWTNRDILICYWWCPMAFNIDTFWRNCLIKKITMAKS